MELRKEAKNIQAKLKKIHIEASDDQNVVKITMDAEQKVLNVEVLQEVAKDQLQTSLVEAMNKAIKKSQEIAAENMKGILGDLSAGM